MQVRNRRTGVAPKLSQQEIDWNNYLEKLECRYYLADELYLKGASARVFGEDYTLDRLIPYLQFSDDDLCLLRQYVLVRQRSMVSKLSNEALLSDFLLMGSLGELNVAQILRRYARAQPDAYQALLTRAIEGIDSSLLQVKLDHPYAALHQLIQLSPTERALIEFLLCKDQSLSLWIETGSGADDVEGQIENLALMLGCSNAELKRIISTNSRLYGAEIIQFDDDNWGDSSTEFVTMGSNFESCIGFDLNAEDLRSRIFPNPIHIQCDEGQFEHLGNSWGDLYACLKGGVNSGQKGVNILIRGVKGSGKTELVHSLLGALQVNGYAIAAQPGRKGSPRNRIAEVARLQSLMGPGAGVIVVEDAAHFFPMSEPCEFGTQLTPGKISQEKLSTVLASNATPTIWLVDHDQPLDWDVMDYFQGQLLLTQSPPLRRERLVESIFANIPISADFKTCLIRSEGITESELKTAARFAMLAYQANTLESLDEGIIRQLKEGRIARDGQLLVLPHLKKSPCDLRFLNLKIPVSMAQVIEAIQRNKAGKLCLFGLPGTGKTCLAEYIAEQINRPLLRYTAADLLGKYVGETEKSMKAMFVKAANEGAVLLLDEADSFFQKREFAHQSWEVTQVNELLQQMEQFEGVFICTTNFSKALDPAVIRRFSLMIEFLPMTLAQRQDMLQLELGTVGLPLDVHIQQRLIRLDSLTPGDFHVVKQQDWLLGHSIDPIVWLERLERIYAEKQSSKPKIGF